MTQRGAALIAAALTAFVLVVAGGIAGRLSQPRTVDAGAPKPMVTARAVERRALAPRPAAWRQHEHEHEHDEGDDD